MRTIRPCFLLVLLSLLSCSAPAVYDINDPKDVFAFQNWPGKEGPLKAGFKFIPTKYPELDGYSIDGESVRIVWAGTSEAVARHVELKKSSGTDEECVLIDIHVATTTTDDAQEILIDWLHRAPGELTLAYQRGEPLGVVVGDVSFVPGSSDITAANTRVVWFVRNNVCVIILRVGDTGVNVAALASSIDNDINSQPDHTVAEVKARKPVISTFSPKQSVLPYLGRTEVSLVASDPQGGSLRYSFHSSIGCIGHDEKAVPPVTEYEHCGSGTKDTLQVTVFNESLLHASATETLLIKEPE